VIWAVSGCTHGRLARSRSTCLEQHPVELHNEPRHHDDQRDGKQVGDRAEHRLAELRQALEQESAKRLAPGARVGEAPEDVAQPAIDHQQAGRDEHQRKQSAKEAWQMRGADDFAARQTL